MTGAAPVLLVDDLEVAFTTDEGRVRAVEGVSFELAPGETLGIVGESGCGKSVTLRSIMRLIPDPPGRITRGRISLMGEDLVHASERRMRALRGDRIAMIFQEPMTALNPVFTIGWQIREALALHQPGLSRKQRAERALTMLEAVGMPDPARRAREYPHQLSGGMRQRVVIAMALACAPDILLADEPTTALDVTTQAQILSLLASLCEELGTAIILVTHDLGVVAEVCDRVLVMYAAQIVEQAGIDDVFHRPAHPYTRALLRSMPGSGPRRAGARFFAIPGMVPDLRVRPTGCRFSERCDIATPRCADIEPPLVALGDGRLVRCHTPLSAPESPAGDRGGVAHEP